MGRLTLDEFSERVETAYRARTAVELVAVRDGLADGPSERLRDRRTPTRLTAGLFGHVVRRGRWRLKRRALAVAAFADVDLDMREAEIDSPQVAMTVVVVFGNVDIYAPEGVDVDVGGIVVFGHRRDWGRDAARAGAPAFGFALSRSLERSTSGACRIRCAAAMGKSCSSSKRRSAIFLGETGGQASRLRGACGRSEAGTGRAPVDALSSSAAGAQRTGARALASAAKASAACRAERVCVTTTADFCASTRAGLAPGARGRLCVARVGGAAPHRH